VAALVARLVAVRGFPRREPGREGSEIALDAAAGGRHDRRVNVAASNPCPTDAIAGVDSDDAPAGKGLQQRECITGVFG
jgi:hypothetical protein